MGGLEAYNPDFTPIVETDPIDKKYEHATSHTPETKWMKSGVEKNSENIDEVEDALTYAHNIETRGWDASTKALDYMQTSENISLALGQEKAATKALDDFLSNGDKEWVDFWKKQAEERGAFYKLINTGLELGYPDDDYFRTQEKSNKIYETTKGPLEKKQIEERKAFFGSRHNGANEKRKYEELNRGLDAAKKYSDSDWTTAHKAQDDLLKS